MDFDEVAAAGALDAVEVARPGAAVRIRHEGRFGRLARRTPRRLSLVLIELVQNAVEHGLAGRDGVVTVSAEPATSEGDDRLEVHVSDDGAGLPAGFDA